MISRSLLRHCTDTRVSTNGILHIAYCSLDARCCYTLEGLHYCEKPMKKSSRYKIQKQFPKVHALPMVAGDIQSGWLGEGAEAVDFYFPDNVAMCLFM